MSILTPEEQVGFYREKGMKILYWSAFFLLFGLVYYLWFGPWLRDATGHVNAILYAFYQLFGIEVGALVIAGIGVLTSLFALKHFKTAKQIKESIGNS